MGLSLRGQTSGAVDINAPAVAGDNTITLPDGNGGANQFYKNSTTAGIVTHSSMVEDSSGRIGIGLNNPDRQLSVSDGDNGLLARFIGPTNNLFINNDRSGIIDLFSSGTGDSLCFGTENTEKVRITGAGNVGINTTIPGHRLTVHTVSAAGYSTAPADTPNPNTLLHLENQNGNDGDGVDNFVAAEFSVGRGATSQGWLGYTRTGDNQGAFFIKQRNAASSYPETIRFPSSGGVTFGGGANVANTLDDYEEGTFTPIDGTGANLALTANTGVYTKIGSIVYCYVRYYLPTTSDTTQHKIAGFPFNNSAANAFSGGYIHYGGSGIDVNFRRFGATDFIATRDGGTTVVTNANLSGQEIQALFIYSTT